jgi:hypothetical protein
MRKIPCQQEIPTKNRSRNGDHRVATNNFTTRNGNSQVATNNPNPAIFAHKKIPNLQR